MGDSPAPLLRAPQVIRPLDSQSEGSESFDPSPYITDLFSCTIRRLKAADIDQEVKERAISCMGQIICNLGNDAECLFALQLPVGFSHSTPPFLPPQATASPLNCLARS